MNLNGCSMETAADVRLSSPVTTLCADDEKEESTVVAMVAIVGNGITEGHIYYLTPRDCTRPLLRRTTTMMTTTDLEQEETTTTIMINDILPSAHHHHHHRSRPCQRQSASSPPTTRGMSSNALVIWRGIRPFTSGRPPYDCFIRSRPRGRFRIWSAGWPNGSRTRLI